MISGVLVWPIIYLHKQTLKKMPKYRCNLPIRGLGWAAAHLVLLCVVVCACVWLCIRWCIQFIFKQFFCLNPGHKYINTWCTTLYLRYTHNNIIHLFNHLYMLVTISANFNYRFLLLCYWYWFWYKMCFDSFITCFNY